MIDAPELTFKLELKLAKASPSQWSTLTTPLPGPAAANASSSATPATPTGDALPDVGIAGPSRAVGGPGKIQAGVENAKQNQRKNWDKVLAGELDDKEDSSDPVGLSFLPTHNRFYMMSQQLIEVECRW